MSTDVKRSIFSIFGPHSRFPKSSSFAHGANDVANSIAPLAAILYIYRNGELNAEAPVSKWILVYGGIGIVLGLLCYGYKVMKTIGYKLTAMSPTRGSTAGLASSLVVSCVLLIVTFPETQIFLPQLLTHKSTSVGCISIIYRNSS